VNLGRKEAFRRRIVPVSFVLVVEHGIGQVAYDRCHDYIAVAPSSTKVEIKAVVLDVLVGCIALDTSAGILSAVRSFLTYHLNLTS
jgi:hypothetical protein